MSLEYITIQRKAGAAADAYYVAWVRHTVNPNSTDSGTLCAVLSKTYEDRLDELLRCLKKQASTIEIGLQIDRTLESKRALQIDRLNLQLCALVH